ncbi:MAG: helix-turn-helix domain-containing protein [Dyella sp.]
MHRPTGRSAQWPTPLQPHRLQVESHLSCRHFSEDKRYPIQPLHGGGFSACKIGAQIGRAPSTINRELRRNTNDDGRHPACNGLIRRYLSGAAIGALTPTPMFWRSKTSSASNRRASG